MPAELRKLAEAVPKDDYSVVDRAIWLEEDVSNGVGQWIRALECVDQHGDKSLLLALLKSKRDLPLKARGYLSDLLARYQLIKKVGGQTTPAYDRTAAEAALGMAVQHVRELVMDGMRVADALEQTCQIRGIPPNILELAYKKRRGSTRRMERRRALQS